MGVHAPRDASQASANVEILHEPRSFGIPRDTESAGHQLADNSGHVIPPLVVRHVAGGSGLLEHEIDDSGGRIEILVMPVLDGNVELFFDAGKKLIEGPAHVVGMQRGVARILYTFLRFSGDDSRTQARIAIGLSSVRPQS